MQFDKIPVKRELIDMVNVSLSLSRFYHGPNIPSNAEAEVLTV